jgi:dTDP-4-dehydrorhamnose reductase
MLDLMLTGANGQLGWEVARRAQAHALSLEAADRKRLDITDRQAVLETLATLRPTVVINAAAYTAVDRAEAEPAMAYAVNHDGVAHLAEGCARSGATLLHFSTDYVFDGRKDGAYREEDAVNPLGVYGASKLAGEEAVRQTLPQHLILRTSWVYGVHGHNFVKTMLRMGRERDKLRVVGDQHGSPTYARDLADAALRITRRLIEDPLASDGFGTFHCAGQGQTTWCGFARRIFAIVGSGSGRDKMPTVEAITTADYPTIAKRPMNSVLDCDRLRQVYGITLRPWEAALADFAREGSEVLV